MNETPKTESYIAGRPTLMAIFQAKIATQAVMDSLRPVGYPQADVLVYHRLSGTDQVVYADTERIAPGQAITEADLTPALLQQVDTVVLMHPESTQLEGVQNALTSLGSAQFLYEEATRYEGRTAGSGPQPLDAIAPTER